MNKPNLPAIRARCDAANSAVFIFEDACGACVENRNEPEKMRAALADIPALCAEVERLRKIIEMALGKKDNYPQTGIFDDTIVILSVCKSCGQHFDGDIPNCHNLDCWRPEARAALEDNDGDG